MIHCVNVRRSRCAPWLQLESSAAQSTRFSRLLGKLWCVPLEHRSVLGPLPGMSRYSEYPATTVSFTTNLRASANGCSFKSLTMTHSGLPSHDAGFKPGELDEASISAIAQGWLDALARAVTSNNGEAFAVLFIAQGYWRDILAFTADYRSIKQPNIANAAEVRDQPRYVIYLRALTTGRVSSDSGNRLSLVYHRP